MKKLQTVLWAIIIVGFVFILINYFSKRTDEQILDSIPSENVEQTANNTEHFKNLIDEGDAFFENKRYPEAIQKYAAAAEINPNSSSVQFKLGQAYLQAENGDQAIDSFYTAYQINPTTEHGLYVAKAALKTNDPESLSTNLEKAKSILAKLDQNSTDVKYNTGLILLLYKDFETAEKLFSEVNNRNSRKFLDQYELFATFKEGSPLYLQTLLAQTLAQIQEYQAAIFLCYDIIEQQKNYRDAWIILGYSYLKTGQYREAIDALSQAKDLDSEHPQALFYLGLAHSLNNQTKEAIYFIKLAEKNGFTPIAQLYLKLGDLYLLQKDYEQSAQYYEKLIAQNTDSLGAFIRLIWLKIEKLDNPEDALKYAQIALKEHPAEAMSYNLTGWAFTAVGNYEKAKEFLSQSLKIQKDFDAAYLNLGWLYHEQGNTALAKKYYEKAFVLGNGNSIGKTAAIRLNELEEISL